MSILNTKAKGRISGSRKIFSIFGKTIFACVSVAWAGFNAFASGIEAGTAAPTCDYGTLESYTGPVGLQAEYEPNQINLHWYNQNQELTVQSAAQTCVYDGVLTPPSTQPTRNGYQFDGWTVRSTSS